MKVIVVMFATILIGLSAFGGGITTIEINDKEYTNVSDVHIANNGQVVVSAGNGLTIASADKFPEGFLKSWNINVESATATEKHKAEEQLENAIAAGDFREIDGIVYDTRNPQSGWTTFHNANVFQALDDGAIVDLTPDQASTFPVHVKNLSAADTDRINFIAKLTGDYSYVNKLGDDRTILDYDMGTVCSRDEIPDSVLSGKKPFDVAVQSGSPTRDVLASLPESDDLQASGSGFFVTEDGYLITNFHVVKDAKKVKVKNKSGTYDAEIVHVDKENDLALIKVSGKFVPLQISKNEAQLGEAVFTIGFPDIALQGVEPKYTDGKISSLAGIKDDPKDYQISVPVQPGNSGGPLVDASGNVVGVIVAKLDEIAALSASGDLPQNINYAIKGKYLNDFLEQFPEVHLVSTESTAAVTNSILSLLGFSVANQNSSESVSPNNAIQTVQHSVAMVLVY